ncbi:MAG: hypothetical protein VR65_01030 [Desulfobulbaceae bacterium BRH_c16a]|nr:MAG: hypothetical protein VR65_01030 [Desulfobulbaceae bacterium BRH_c16a]
MTQHRHGILVLAAILLLFSLTSSLAALQSETDPEPENTVWAWADKTGSQHAIFISRRVGTEWEEPIQVSNNKGINVVPSVTKTNAQDLFIVWSAFSGQQAQLRYRQYNEGVWGEEKEYYTGLSSNTAPSISIDTSGTVWLAWAGFNGISDEIYYSTWDGNAFKTAQPLTTNDVPDIQPILAIDETTGQPWVQWQQYSEKGYIALEATWNGSAWSTPVETTPAATAKPPVEATSIDTATPEDLRVLTLKKVVPAGTAGTAGTAEKSSLSTRIAAKKTGRKGNDLEIEIPTFVKNPESASVHIPGYTIQSLPVRSVVPIN